VSQGCNKAGLHSPIRQTRGAPSRCRWLRPRRVCWGSSSSETTADWAEGRGRAGLSCGAARAVERCKRRQIVVSGGLGTRERRAYGRRCGSQGEDERRGGTGYGAGSRRAARNERTGLCLGGGHITEIRERRVARYGTCTARRCGGRGGAATAKRAKLLPGSVRTTVWSPFLSWVTRARPRATSSLSMRLGGLRTGRPVSSSSTRQ